ncbi:ribonuclease HII [Candidatus Methylocalor cossyra]|uniref:Ribonuclease HII n=1 Tax=Candidatus Methylocalor cossyra TaxID=3108543 RepID=A0ABM9NFF3_9GAMM
MAGQLGSIVAGYDEVGRGCIAGPVIAAAVLFRAGDCPVPGLADSKTLDAQQRAALAPVITRRAVAWAIGRAEVGEIDRLNILEASLLAMRRAHAALPVAPDWALVDGNRYPGLPCPGRAVIGGDRSEPVISAASILAKVFRDREMGVLDLLHPGYGFAAHKGYPTQSHRLALKALGISPAHRRSFAPVRQLAERLCTSD